MLSDFFDTAGTVVSVASEGGWLKKDGTIERADRVFWVDSLGALFGGIAAWRPFVPSGPEPRAARARDRR